MAKVYVADYCSPKAKQVSFSMLHTHEIIKKVTGNISHLKPTGQPKSMARGTNDQKWQLGQMLAMFPVEDLATEMVVPTCPGFPATRAHGDGQPDGSAVNKKKHSARSHVEGPHVEGSALSAQRELTN